MIELLPTLAPAKTVAATLGARAARPVMVLMVGPALEGVEVDLANRRLGELVARWGGETQSLVSGSCLVTFGVGGARELAVRAARAALELRSVAAGRTMALALGRATVEGRELVGAAIDETTRLVAVSPSAAAAVSAVASVFVDADTAQLLNEQFEIQVHTTDAGVAHELRAEVSASSSSRLVMGKRVPFVGRDRELRALEALTSECFEEPRCGASLVLAPAGGGKSRLKREVLTRLSTEHDPLLTLMGTADAFRAGAPYEILGAAFRQAAQIQNGDPPLLQCHKLQTFLAPSAPRMSPADLSRVVAFLGEMSGLETAPHMVPLLLSARQDARTMADQVRLAWLDWLGAALAETPVLLVLEDLHWGDAPSIQLIDAAMKTYRSLPLMVLAFARPEVNTRFPNLWKDSADRVSLPPLRARAARDLVKSVLPDLSEARMAALTERADGNPFFLEELLRVEAARGEGTDHSTPTTVLAAVQGRLDHLGDQGKRVLRAASVFGESFRADGVVALLPASVHGDVSEWLDVLANAELVMPPDLRSTTGDVAAGDDRWRFRHALVRDAAYDTLTDADRKVGHNLAARFLETAGERDGVVLASHYECAGETHDAAVNWRIAAEQALDASDLDGVFERCARAEALGPEGYELGRVKFAACRAHSDRGEWEEAEVDALSALPVIKGDTRFELWRYLVNAKSQQQDSVAAKAAFLVLFESRDNCLSNGQWVLATLRAAPSLLFQNEIDLVKEVLVTLEEQAHSGDLRGRAAWYSLRSHLHLLGRPLESIQDGLRALELLIQVGDFREAAGVLNNLVCTLADMGRLEEAEARAHELIALCQRLGASFTLLEGRINLAGVLVSRGDQTGAAKMLSALLGDGELDAYPRLAGFCQILPHLRRFSHGVTSQGRWGRAWRVHDLVGGC